MAISTPVDIGHGSAGTGTISSVAITTTANVVVGDLLILIVNGGSTATSGQNRFPGSATSISFGTNSFSIIDGEAQTANSRCGGFGYYCVATQNQNSGATLTTNFTSTATCTAMAILIKIASGYAASPIDAKAWIAAASTTGWTATMDSAITDADVLVLAGSYACTSGSKTSTPGNIDGSVATELADFLHASAGRSTTVTYRQLSGASLDAKTGAGTWSGTAAYHNDWILAILPESGTTYNDTPSGTISLSGSKTESLGHSPSPSGTVALSGSISESYQVANTYNDSPSGTISLSGTNTESKTYTESPWGKLGVYGLPRIGACIHDWYAVPFLDEASVMACATSLGAQVLRGVNPEGSYIADWAAEAQAHGIKLMLAGSEQTIPDADWLTAVESIVASYPGIFIATEGRNETDIFFTHTGQCTDKLDGETWDEYALRYQQALWNLCKGSDSAEVRQLIVLSGSIGHPEDSAVATAMEANPLAGYCDAANLHYYPGNALPNQTTVNSRFAQLRAYAGMPVDGPCWVTETGYSTDGLSEATIAQYYPDLLDALLVDATYPADVVTPYQLVNDTTSSDFGIYNTDYSPRQQAAAIRQVIRLYESWGHSRDGSGTTGLSGSKTESASYTDSPSGTIGLSGSIIEQYVPPGTIYTDTPSGTVSVSGTKTESFSHDSTVTGTIGLSGTKSESLSHDSAVSGTIGLSGTDSESLSRNPTVTGTIGLSGADTESLSHDSSVSGTITLTGSISESYVPPGETVYNDSPSGTIRVTGDLTDEFWIRESAEYADSPAGTIGLNGTLVESLALGAVSAVAILSATSGVPVAKAISVGATATASGIVSTPAVKVPSTPVTATATAVAQSPTESNTYNDNPSGTINITGSIIESQTISMVSVSAVCTMSANISIPVLRTLESPQAIAYALAQAPADGTTSAFIPERIYRQYFKDRTQVTSSGRIID